MTLGSKLRGVVGFLVGAQGEILSLQAASGLGSVEVSPNPDGRKGLFWLNRSGALGNSTILVLLELVSAPELERPKVFYVSFLVRPNPGPC